MKGWNWSESTPTHPSLPSPPQTSNLNRDQLATPVTMTTSVNHTAAVGFQMGTYGTGLGMAAQTSECRVQFTHLTHVYKHLAFLVVNMLFHTSFTGRWQKVRVWWEYRSCWQLTETVAVYDIKICQWQSNTHMVSFQFFIWLNTQTLRTRCWIQLAISTNVLHFWKTCRAVVPNLFVSSKLSTGCYQFNQ